MWRGEPIPNELEAFPGYLLARLGETSRQRFGEAIEPVGLDPRHFRVLTIVGARPGVTQQQLREMTAIDPSSMVVMLDGLEQRGLAERRRSVEDKRIRTVHLTEQGELARLRVVELAIEMQDELLAPLSEQERLTLHELLRKLTHGHALAREGSRSRRRVRRRAVAPRN